MWRKPLARFFGLFLLVYILLILPWTGWERAYGVWFRMIGRTVFHTSESGQRELTFERLGQEPHPEYTRIEIVNRALMQPDGSGPVRYLDLDPIAFSWKLTALLIALIVATPISWRRRGVSLFWGLICLHVIIMAFLGFSIWSQSAEVGLVTLSPFWKQVSDGIQEFVLWEYSAVVPVMVWLLVTFRKEDRLLSACLSLFGPAKNKIAKGKVKADKKATAKAGKQTSK